MKMNSINALILDVDGVLTTGELYFAASGELIKVFHVQDGTAIKRWLQRGYRMAWLSGRKSDIVDRRAAELGVSTVIQGQEDKLAPFHRLLDMWSLPAESVCYVGDDLPDIPPMRICGCAVAVANAAAAVKRQADLVTTARGGRGAVREIIDLLLASQDQS